MHKEIWIASHITQPEGINYLHWCLDSIKNDAIIVISSSSSLELNIFKDVILYKHQDQMKQFQHIKYIWNQRKDILPEDSVILFLDDDDMLLSKSNIEYKDNKNRTFTFSDPFEEILANSNIPGLSGLQILGLENNKNWSNLTIDMIPSFCEITKRELVSDFSGTVIRKKYLEQYLSTLNFSESAHNDVFNLLYNLIDCMFMKFIESLPNGREANNVTVFHRVKCYKSEWQQF
jgi:hypothetical protein